MRWPWPRDPETTPDPPPALPDDQVIGHIEPGAYLRLPLFEGFPTLGPAMPAPDVVLVVLEHLPTGLTAEATGYRELAEKAARRRLEELVASDGMASMPSLAERRAARHG